MMPAKEKKQAQFCCFATYCAEYAEKSARHETREAQEETDGPGDAFLCATLRAAPAS